MKLLDDGQLEQFERHLTGLLERELVAEGCEAFNAVIRRFVMRGGKRVRPQLCWWTLRHCGSANTDHGLEDGGDRGVRVDQSRSANANLLDVCAAWELFHAFLLAHDDIIDAADHRRDQPALHRQLAELDSNSLKFGSDLAIVAGDLLYTSAMKLLHDLEIDPRTHVRLLRLFSRIATTTGFGQVIDICQSHVPLSDVQELTLLREYHWKTAAYTFEGPMLSGAILAGLDEAAHEPISAYALAMGQAYQLHNDLCDLSQPARPGCDLMEGKRTLTLLQARRALTHAQRRLFDRQLAELPRLNGQALTAADELRSVIFETGAIRQTQDMIQTLLHDAEAAVGHRALPEALSRAMGGLLERLAEGYFVKV